jgi:hypothetical protein
MSADQIAVIRPALLEAIQGAPSTCVTLELEGDADKWLQFVDSTINAAYPYDTDPLESVKPLPALAEIKLVGWEFRKFATFKISEVDAMTIARWIDGYFVGVLDCPADYDLDVVCEEL